MTPEVVTRRIVEIIESRVGSLGLRVRLWNGEEFGAAGAPATLVLNHPGALRAMLFPPGDLTAGEAYVYGDVDIEGDIIAGMTAAARVPSALGPGLTAARVIRLLRKLPDDSRRRDATRPDLSTAGRRHSKRRDRQAIRHHYDVGNDFYKTFLDERMVYSCGTFLSENDSLDDAQLRKLDMVCRKLRLRPGMRLLDVGCGWGGLIRHAATHYGVRAVGVTLSHEQADYARKSIAEAGLTDRVEVMECDYRDVSGTFDAIASIVMFEHVGADQLGVYFGHLRSLLAPGGTVLNHGITTRDRKRHWIHRPSFVSTYVFPDGELEPIETVIGAAERAGFEVRDLESLRTSYALTLRRWVANLERNREAAIAASDERTYRIWRVYMAGASVAFSVAGISVYQAVLAPPDSPWSFGRSWALAADDAAPPGHLPGRT